MYIYHLVNGEIKETVDEKIDVKGTSYTISEGTLETGENYRWTVAVVYDGDKELKSPPLDFTVNPPINKPPPPTAISPSGITDDPTPRLISEPPPDLSNLASITNTSDPPLSTDSNLSPHATGIRYEFQVKDTSTNTIILSETIARSELQIQDNNKLQSFIPYEWQVRVYDGSQWSEYSSPLAFEIQTTPIIERFDAHPITVEKGERITFSWSTKHSDTLTLSWKPLRNNLSTEDIEEDPFEVLNDDDTPLQTLARRGSVDVTGKNRQKLRAKITGEFEFTLEATNSVGNSSEKITVAVLLRITT